MSDTTALVPALFLTLALAHTTRPGTTSAKMTKITKATVFVELDSGAAERFNRTTGKRVGGNYREGDLIITPADLQRITEAESAPADATAERDTDDCTVQPKRTPEEVERAAAEQRELLEQGRTEAPAEGDDEEESTTPGAKPRAKGDLRIDTREIVDTGVRVGRAATRCRNQAEFYEAVGTASALAVATHLRAAVKAYEAAAELAPKVKLASKENGGVAAVKGFVPGAVLHLTDAGKKVYGGILKADAVLTMVTNRGRVMECTAEGFTGPLFVERKYLVADAG